MFKVGDLVVIVHCTYSFDKKGTILTVSKIHKDQIRAKNPLSTLGRLWRYDSYKVVPKDVYDSPLYQLMKEEENA